MSGLLVFSFSPKMCPRLLWLVSKDVVFLEITGVNARTNGCSVDVWASKVVHTVSNTLLLSPQYFHFAL